jgi:hypothetical protein
MCMPACRFPLDLDKLPEQAAQILEDGAIAKESQLLSKGQNATHTALDAVALAALDMNVIDRTIESIVDQVTVFRPFQSIIS